MNDEIFGTNRRPIPWGLIFWSLWPVFFFTKIIVLFKGEAFEPEKIFLNVCRMDSGI
jgi:hypothetical protein